MSAWARWAGRLWRLVRHEEARAGYLLVAPLLLHFAVFTAYPTLYSIYLSFHEWNMLAPAPTYVGLNNYRELLQDPLFRRVLWQTVYYTLVVTAAIVVGSLGVALLMNQRLRGIGFWRAVYYVPAVTSVIMVAVIWVWLYEPSYGLLNQLLRAMGLPPLRWLSDPGTAMNSVILTQVWRNLGYFGVIFLAGLQGIDRSYYEAAQIDGAGPWRLLRHITLPLLKPTILLVTVMCLILSFQVFGLIYAMTGGGPADSTQVLVYYLYKQAFVSFRMGYASAIGYTIFAILFVLTLIQHRFLGKHVES